MRMRVPPSRACILFLLLDVLQHAFRPCRRNTGPGFAIDRSTYVNVTTLTYSMVASWVTSNKNKRMHKSAILRHVGHWERPTLFNCTYLFAWWHFEFFIYVWPKSPEYTYYSPLLMYFIPLLAINYITYFTIDHWWFANFKFRQTDSLVTSKIGTKYYKIATITSQNVTLCTKEQTTPH